MKVLYLATTGAGDPTKASIPLHIAANGSVEANQECAVVLAGDATLYWIGHHWGEHIMDWRVTRLVLTPDREKTMVNAYHRHGVKIVFTARFVAGPPGSYANIKRTINRRLYAGFDELLELETELQQGRVESADFMEAVLAFAQKREAKFTGA